MINFKDRIKKGVQQQQNSQNSGWTKQNMLNKTGSKKDLFRQVSNQLSSQHFEAGDFRKTDYIPSQLSKKRNSGIIEMEYQEDVETHLPTVSNYGGGTQRSLLNSNVADNYNGSLFQSKLHQTKGQLSQQIIDLEKRMRRQIQTDRNFLEDYLSKKFNKHTEKTKEQQRKYFEQIVISLNKNLYIISSKQKSYQGQMVKTKEELDGLSKKFKQFTQQTEQKIEKIMNTNIDVASSMKKSLSRNMGNGDYMVQLKNSIKDIPLLNSGLVQQIRSQIHEVQQAIKNLKLDMTYVKQDLKNKTMDPMEIHKNKPQMVQITKLNYIQQQINGLKAQIQSFETQQQSKFKFKQLHNILQIQQQNYIGINDTFQKTLNNNILPKLKKLQEQVQVQSIQRNAQYLKKQVVKQLQTMPIIRVKVTTQQQKQRFNKMKQLPKSQQQAYMLDQYNHIIDCFGNYLLDQNNQRMKLEEDQIYYLQQMEGIQIKMSGLQVK